MNIQILQLIEGAKRARGLTVVIDVFRAFSVEAYFLHMGAEKIIPVGDVQLAYDLKKQNPEVILTGERHGRILPGFDCGNSPTRVLTLDVVGKTIVHTTSAGTQGIANAMNATEILGGSLLTAKATAEYIRQSGAQEVSLVCMGLEAIAPTEEDTLCAEYIKSLLEGTPLDVQEEAKKLKYTSGAKFFDPVQCDVFPESDFHLCTKIDKFDFVVKMIHDKNGLGYMVKETIL